MAYIDIPVKDNTTPLTPTEWNYLVDKLNARRLRDIIDVEDADPVTGDMIQHNGSGWVYWDITGEYYNKDEIDAILGGEDGGGIGTPSTVQSLSINYDTGVLTLKQENAPDRDVILSWFALDEKAKFSGGAWVSSTYKKNTFTRDGDYLGIALRETTDRLSPARVGEPYYPYQGVGDVENTTTAKHVLLGTRFTADHDGYVQGYKLYTYAGFHYTIYSVIDPGPNETYELILEFIAENTGFQDYTISERFFKAGVIFDIIYSVTELDANPVTFNANYNYLTPNNDIDPITGEIIHANKSTDILRVNKFDDDGTDQTTNLQALVAGDRIVLGAQTWTISESTENAATFDFVISPEVQYAPDGVYSFSFSHTVDATIHYQEELGYWTPYPNVQGLYSLNGGYDDIVLTEDFFGIDVLFQEATVSEDWFILAVTGASGSGGDDGSAAIDIIDNLTTPRTDAALSANQGLVLDTKKADKEHTLDSHSDVNTPAPLGGQNLIWDDSAMMWVSRYSLAGLGIVELNYKYRTDDTTPNEGYVSTDNSADPTAVTMLYFNKITLSGNDVSQYLVEIKYGDWLNLHLFDDFDSHQKYDVLGPAVLNGDIWEVPVSHYETTGNALSNNDKLGVLWRLRSAPIGLGTDDVMNQSELDGTTATDALNALNANKQENSIPVAIQTTNFSPSIVQNAYFVKAQDSCSEVALSAGTLPIGFNQIIYNDTLSDINIVTADNWEGINEPIPAGQQGYYVLSEAGLWTITTPVNLDWILPRDIQIVKPSSDYTTQTDESGFYVMGQNGCNKILLDSTGKSNGYNQIVYNQSDSDIIFESSVGSIDGENNPIPPNGQGHYVLNGGVWTVTTPIIIEEPLDTESPIFVGLIRAVDNIVTEAPDTEAPVFVGLIRAIDSYTPEPDTEAPIFVGLIRAIGDEGSDYVHPTGPGYYHMPSGGSVGQVIKNTANGNGTWQDENTGDTGPDTESPIFTGSIRVRTDRGEIPFLQEENAFTEENTFQDIRTKKISVNIGSSDAANIVGNIPVAPWQRLIDFEDGTGDKQFQIGNLHGTAGNWAPAILGETDSDGPALYFTGNASGVTDDDAGVIAFDAQADGSIVEPTDKAFAFNSTWGNSLLSIYGGGNVTVHGNMTATGSFNSSDRRLKENIKMLDDKFCSFNFRTDELTRYGVIAQDIQETEPEVVHADSDGLLSVDYISLLVKEIVELKKQVKELQDGRS